MKVLQVLLLEAAASGIGAEHKQAIQAQIHVTMALCTSSYALNCPG